ncbi:hypothetical protein [Streptomyces luteireticuli]|uniref:hypothetical protein n=1 Tax=Streptomyces luteireticuli TaxID=173858 RepID=UPI00355619B2
MTQHITLPPAAGQTWAHVDSRMDGRTLHIGAVHAPYAYATVLTTTQPNGRVGHRVRIGLDSLTGGGHLLVPSPVPDEEEDK